MPSMPSMPSRYEPLFHLVLAWVFSSGWWQSFCSVLGWRSVSFLLTVCTCDCFTSSLPLYLAASLLCLNVQSVFSRLTGSSSASETYGNSCLAHTQDFDVKEVEVLPSLLFTLTFVVFMSEHLSLIWSDWLSLVAHLKLSWYVCLSHGARLRNYYCPVEHQMMEYCFMFYAVMGFYIPFKVWRDGLAAAHWGTRNLALVAGWLAILCNILSSPALVPLIHKLGAGRLMYIY